MKLDVQFTEIEQTFTPNFGEVQTASDGGYERGYAAGYEAGNADGKAYGKTAVSTLPNFKGQPTGNDGEFYWEHASQNTPWVTSSVIQFDGNIGDNYLISAELKCSDSVNNLGIGFLYEDGTTDFGMRRSLTSYFVSAVASNPEKKVVGIGFAYGLGGSLYARNFVVQTV